MTVNVFFVLWVYSGSLIPCDYMCERAGRVGGQHCGSDGAAWEPTCACTFPVNSSISMCEVPMLSSYSPDSISISIQINYGISENSYRSLRFFSYIHVVAGSVIVAR